MPRRDWLSTFCALVTISACYGALKIVVGTIINNNNIIITIMDSLIRILCEKESAGLTGSCPGEMKTAQLQSSQLAT